MRGGLTRRTILASAVLALLIGAVFAVLIRAVSEERDSAERAIRSLEVIAAANRLERLMLDLETGQRGYLITREQRFLQPWEAARAAYPRLADALEAAAGRGGNGQAQAAREIVSEIESYIESYSVPLVEAARQGDASAESDATLEEGKQRVDRLRAQFDEFGNAERRRFVARDAAAESDARWAIVLGTAGLAVSTLLIVLFGGYLTRGVALPIRRAATMAGRLAGGDLATRMPETGAGEVGELERSFNTMADSLGQSQDDLRRIADEQAALRRVATLVARDVDPAELFEAAASEVRMVLGANLTALVRYDDDAAMRLALSSDLDVDAPESARLELDPRSVVTMVFQTGRSARVDYEGEGGGIREAARRLGVRTSLAAPIVVGGRLWGAMVAAWRPSETPSPDIEERMTQFTELIATAIANAESRAELAASRARVVATADETRRRIERDLHDGAQQSLVHTVIAIQLARRALTAGGNAGQLLDDALGHAERANDDLRELAHGILPATLTRGLGAAIETLVSRVRLPVSITVTDERLAPDLEATAYFIAAEALTNAVKHARASRAEVIAVVEDGTLRVEVRDDGVGGARADGRSGLLGLYDRAAAMNGELHVHSPPGGGTTVSARIPVP